MWFEYMVYTGVALTVIVGVVAEIKIRNRK